MQTLRQSFSDDHRFGYLSEFRMRLQHLGQLAQRRHIVGPFVIVLERLQRLVDGDHIRLILRIVLQHEHVVTFGVRLWHVRDG
jgi:hypothetical protein